MYKRGLGSVNEDWEGGWGGGVGGGIKGGIRAQSWRRDGSHVVMTVKKLC